MHLFSNAEQQERPTVVANRPRDAFIYVCNRAFEWRYTLLWW